ncbi:MAG: ethanolamine ammonia-lyase subunit EutB, partial [Planctomycetaceae bacterium]
MHRRNFLWLGCSATGFFLPDISLVSASDNRRIDDALERNLADLGSDWNPAVCRRILGAANEPKEGDQIVGVAAADSSERQRAREILLQTRL